MLFASIDIGSNAVRLYFANVFELKGEAVLEKASLVRIPLRLGEDVFKTGKSCPLIARKNIFFVPIRTTIRHILVFLERFS